MVIDERFVTEVLHRLEEHLVLLNRIADRKEESPAYTHMQGVLLAEVTRAQIDVVRYILGEKIDYIR